MRLFREGLLARLALAHAISRELVKKLLVWKHPGFSEHVGEPIAPTDKVRLEDTTAYLVRNSLSLKKISTPSTESSNTSTCARRGRTSSRPRARSSVSPSRGRVGECRPQPRS
ncbi:MAG TPA: hypothetical protein VMK42_00555 [Anaeromyxobacteraceae bacterium]|nr:hypothetical protein [Anaeromyxobacteraceae bacterium]